MQIAKIYSHKDGLEYIKERHAAALQDIQAAVAACDAVACLRKVTEEQTKPPLLYSPVAMNASLKLYLSERGWTIKAPDSKKGFREPRLNFGGGRFREMDGIKDKVGLEIQFGKYAFMGYDIFAKMPIFAKKGMIECGIEVVAMPSVVKVMSTGVSSFAQVVLDMEIRGVADIDLPTIVVGMDLTGDEVKGSEEKAARYKADGTGMIARGEVDAPRAGARPGPKAQRRPSLRETLASPDVEPDGGEEELAHESETVEDEH